MKLALLLPDGVGVRNFLLGPFARAAVTRGPVALFHVIPDALVADYAAPFGASMTWHSLRPFDAGRVAETLGSALGYAHMHWGDTRAMRRRLAIRPHAPTVGRWAMTTTARLVGRAAATEAGISWLARQHQARAAAAPAVAHYRRTFQTLRPSVVFASHQRPPEVLAPVLAARSLGIPTATFVFSWDNLTSKGRILAPFEHYLVWSALMREELLRFYPSVAPEQVHVVGTPQFEPYTDRSLEWTRQDFCARLGLDPDRPIICYSGGDAGTCPDDAAHVRLILEMIREGRILGRPQLLLRPSPVDNGGRYAAVREAFPELVYCPPTWRHPEPDRWSRAVPTADDLPLLANLTRHSDVNVNVASTMTLDFALHDRPVVNVAFDMSQPPPLGTPIWDLYYQYDHYRPVMELGAARIARSPDSLAAQITAYLADPSLDREGRRRLVELQVMSPLAGASERILSVLEQIGRVGGAAIPATEHRPIDSNVEYSRSEAIGSHAAAAQLSVARLEDVP